MEKLQAALARARAQRDGDPLVERGQGGRPYSRTRARAEAQDAAITELWGEIPLFEPAPRRLRASRIFASDATNESAQFDILRTKLLIEMRRNGWSRVGITSAASGSGKTTTACNLIAGFGRQPEVRGMLFDFDLRRPSVGKFFGATPEASLVDVLEERVHFEDQALRLHDNTIVSMTTRPMRDPGQLLNRASVGEILDDIQQTYRPDIMIFDLPPVLISDETRAFMRHIDTVLIVAAANSTTLSQIDDCEREVSEYSNVAGVVLNKCRHLEDGYGYSY